MFRVKCRYEYRVARGKQWTEWFNTSGKFDTIEAAEKDLEVKKKLSDPIDKVTKLKHEFKIEQEDA